MEKAARHCAHCAVCCMWTQHTTTAAVVVSYVNIYKGSAWVPAYASTHAPGRAGQHFGLFDSILGRVKKSPHTIIVCAFSM